MRAADRTLDPATRVKIAKAIGMVGSSSDHEALTAARMADRLVRESGITWVDLICGPLPKAASSSSNAEDPIAGWPGGWRAAVATCLRHGDGLLTDFERRFCHNLAGYRGECSIKQRHMLRGILDKVLEAGCVP